MKKPKEEEIIVESEFNREEKFDFDHIPEHFGSVTDLTLKRIQESALDSVREVTNFTPGALNNALDSLDGQFNSAFSTLEGDYGKRVENLKSVYKEGLSELRKAFLLYKVQVTNYNTALKNYSKANEVINGERLPNYLLISDEDMRKLEEKIEGLRKGE